MLPQAWITFMINEAIPGTADLSHAMQQRLVGTVTS